MAWKWHGYMSDTPNGVSIELSDILTSRLVCYKLGYTQGTSGRV